MLHDLAFGVEEVRGALHLVFDTIFSYLFLDVAFVVGTERHCGT